MATRKKSQIRVETGPRGRMSGRLILDNFLPKLVFSIRNASRTVAILLTLWSPLSHATTLTPAGAAVLVFHRFGQTASSTIETDAALDDQLAWLASHVSVGPLRSVIDPQDGNIRPADRPCVAITVDDGHQSVYTDFYPRVLRYRLPVTLFIYPSAISNASYALTWPQLAEMQASGLVDIESHTYWHPNFRVEKAHRSPSSYRSFVDMQLSRSKQVIEARLGRAVTMLAWPYGIYDEDLEAAATRAGYIAGFGLGNTSVLPGSNMLALPRIAISDNDRSTRLASILATVCPRNKD